jgi:acetyltransferase-like isoleucine patch superfamily enzyme
MLKNIYLSPVGYLISFFLNILSFFQKPFMVYGFYNRVTGSFMKNSRISSSTRIINKALLDLSNDVWIGHYCVLDASNQLTIEKGVQTGSHISIYTHSSHISLRLLGESYISSNDRIGYVKGSVVIGEYSFIGDSTVIFPGVNIGRGCLIKAGSVVTSSIPNFSIVAGNPAKVVGKVVDIDSKFFINDIVRECYFDKKIIEDYDKSI